jgi:hypothetical protein
VGIRKRMMAFPAEKALLHARNLSFPRRAGGSGGRRSQQYLVGELEKLGYGISQEKFPIQADPSLLLKSVLCLTLLALVVSYLISKNHPLPAALLMSLPLLLILNAGRIWKALMSGGRLPFKPRTYLGVNLVASVAPKNPIAKEILLVAHYDSKSQSLSLARRSLFLVSLGLLCLIIVTLYVSAAFPDLTIFSPPTRKQMGFLSAVTALCTLMLYKNKTFDTSPGALDDASGVGVLLALAEMIKACPPSSVKVTFLLTDAEEDGLLGAWAYVKSHAAELSFRAPFVLNLEGITSAKRLWLKGKGRAGSAAMILQLAKERGTPLHRVPGLPGVLMDDIPFAARGLEAVSLFGLSLQSFHIHTPKDRADLLEESGLREAGELLAALIYEMDGGRSLSLPRKRGQIGGTKGA